MNRACLILLANLAALFRLCAADFQPETLPLGSPAPDFSLTGVDGRTYTLKNGLPQNRLRHGGQKP
jgi:hypothetical protein